MDCSPVEPWYDCSPSLPFDFNLIRDNKPEEPSLQWQGSQSTETLKSLFF